MALSAVVTLNLSTVQVEQKCNATITVTNPDLVDVSIVDIYPTVRETSDPVAEDASSVAFGRPPLGPNVDAVVPASGTKTFSFGLNVHGPTADTYSVGAQLLASDGQSFVATPATLTVTRVV